MLIQPPSAEEPSRNPRRERGLWHDGAQNMLSMGCTNCPERNVCGGLQLSKALFDCLGFCCRKPADCDKVCPNRPEAFARSVREVDGFLFDNVPRAAILAKPLLPSIVPVLYHGSKRVTPFRAPAVSLPLYGVIARHNGGNRFASAQELAEKFGFAGGASVVLTGTDTDAPLERWWSLGKGRREAIRALLALNISLVTTPNYSLFTDRPRWDDLHSMKRIAIVHEEFLSEGLPAALHLNARTERDWERWRAYISGRPEVTHVAFEFGTGAGWATRSPWHADQLKRLSLAAGRPLHLILRGGSKLLPELITAFAEITFLETSVFMKTKSRQRAVSVSPGTVKWCASPTEINEPVDSLLTENWKVVAASYAALFDRSVPPLQAVG